MTKQEASYAKNKLIWKSAIKSDFGNFSNKHLVFMIPRNTVFKFLFEDPELSNSISKLIYAFQATKAS